MSSEEIEFTIEFTADDIDDEIDIDFEAEKGIDGAVYVPRIDKSENEAGTDLLFSFSNTGELPDPEPVGVNIRNGTDGPQGPPGEVDALTNMEIADLIGGKLS